MIRRKPRTSRLATIGAVVVLLTVFLVWATAPHRFVPMRQTSQGQR
jgi:hypothetical protein